MASGAQAFVPSGERSMMKPLSLSDLSSQVRSIRDAETSVVSRPCGAAGAVVNGAIASAMFETSLSPAALVATIS